MRLIAGQTPGYETIEVYLDGNKIEHCFEADDELGKVWVHDESAHEGYRVKQGVVEFRTIAAAQTNQNRTVLRCSDPYCDICNKRAYSVHSVDIMGYSYSFDTPVYLNAGDTLQINVRFDDEEGLIMDKIKVITTQ